MTTISVPPVFCCESNCRPRTPDTRIDDAEENGCRRKPSSIGRQQIGRCLRIADRRIGKEVDNGYAGYLLVQHRFHLPRIVRGNYKQCALNCHYRPQKLQCPSSSPIYKSNHMISF
jgi:hypothetical protein